MVEESRESANSLGIDRIVELGAIGDSELEQI
jgi:hypothetical protein